MKSPLQLSIIPLRGTPVLLQSEAAECGFACLAMISGRYGHSFDLPALRRHYQLSHQGMTLQDVVRLRPIFDSRRVR